MSDNPRPYEVEIGQLKIPREVAVGEDRENWAVVDGGSLQADKQVAVFDRSKVPQELGVGDIVGEIRTGNTEYGYLLSYQQFMDARQEFEEANREPQEVPQAEHRENNRPPMGVRREVPRHRRAA